MKMFELIEGAAVRIGETTYVCPPISVRQYRQHRDKLHRLAAVAGLPSDDELTAIVAVLHAALSRNYPDLTVEQLEDMIDVGNIAALIRAVTGQAAPAAAAD